MWTPELITNAINCSAGRSSICMRGAWFSNSEVHVMTSCINIPGIDTYHLRESGRSVRVELKETLTPAAYIDAHRGEQIKQIDLRKHGYDHKGVTLNQLDG